MKSSKLFIAGGAVALVVASAFTAKPAKKFQAASNIYTASGTLIATIATTSHLTTGTGGLTKTITVSINGGSALNIYDNTAAANQIRYK
jgi:hypothetical protein